jgi:peptidoglycan hydrolase CwlO-like protein
MKKVFLFIKKYWLFIVGGLGVLILLITRIVGGRTRNQEEFLQKVEEQKKENEKAIKEADEQIKKNNDTIKSTDETVDDVKGNTEEVKKNKEERDKKANNIFNVGDKNG